MIVYLGRNPWSFLGQMLLGPVTPQEVLAPESPRSEEGGVGPFLSPMLLVGALGSDCGEGSSFGLGPCPAYFSKLGNSTLTWIICSNAGFVHWRLCEMK